jgi:Flp pilus assembly pilin Flp
MEPAASAADVETVVSTHRREGGESHMTDFLTRLFAEMRDEDGQTMAEYAVVLGVITVAVVAALTVLSGTISSVLSSVTAAM